MIVYNDKTYYNKSELLNILNESKNKTSNYIFNRIIIKYIKSDNKKFYCIPNSIGVGTYFKSLLYKDLEHEYTKIFNTSVPRTKDSYINKCQY